MLRRNYAGVMGKIPPHYYSHEYFTTDCEGYDIFLQGSSDVSERIRGVVDSAGDLRGKRVLDLGCGRGELACEAARRGAHVVGVDYSQAAIELACQRLEILEPEERERVVLILEDVCEIDFKDKRFDVIFMVDLYEHLQPQEIEEVLRKVKALLAPGGRLIIHTGPNTWFYRYGYPLIRIAARVLLRKKTRETLRGSYDALMHVNEQSPLSLYKDLRKAGFKARVIPRHFFTGFDRSPLMRVAMKVLFEPPLGYVFAPTIQATARL